MEFRKQSVLLGNASLVAAIQRIADVCLIVTSLSVVCFFEQRKWLLSHWVMVLVAIVIFQLVAEATDFYRSWRGVPVAKEIKNAIILITCTLCCSLLILLLFVEFSRPDIVFIAKWYISLCISISVFRFCLRNAVGYLRGKGYNKKNAAIVGKTSVGTYLGEQLILSPWLGISVVGYYDDNETGFVEIDNEKIPVLGELEQLVNDAKGGKIDRIYITLPMCHEKRIRELITELSDTTCSVLFVPDIFTFNLLHSRSFEINGIPLISIFDTPMVGSNVFIKRIEDIILSSIILLLISPILCMIALAVKFTSSGPIIFKQNRYGIDGREINVWKFRSMNVMENGGSVSQAKKGDKRFTPIGAFLRQTSLDELPQFINVLKGDMSIVGPRPHAVAHNEQYRKIIKGYMLRHKVKPGITGLAQVNGWRGETDTLEKMEKRIEYDLEYIRTWSLWLDFKIVFFTIFKGFINKNAY
ncbi:undecaprenyl-phosphate glucose phosphotransferase [uncultured Tolumonas sp.]|uniref:undecaprenyl-phosphate glucose phosphotransferase n=1 Tax=uncultured Tolumonas sp. TaxID=263765 RepID=UPI00292DB4CB|nr:undecaprenyl-phosphate glucose phosphotransferase [uncultured Tolumonas sp.]